MSKKFALKKSISINSSILKVWEALTNPELIKKYFFGTECVTDWKKGSPILFKGIWDGKPYEDKGKIIDIEKEKFIHYSYWSAFSGTEDIPENYATIKYELSTDYKTTTFTIIQEGFETQEACDHSSKNWGHVMEGLTKM